MDIITYALSKKNTGGSSGATEEQATQIQTNTNNISELKEDISLLSKEKADYIYVDNKITDLKAQDVQQTPLFANSIEECTDTTKVYVLPDGYIYGRIAKQVEGGTVANFTNQLPISKDASGNIYNGVGYKTDTYLSSGNEGARAGVNLTGFIPIGNIVYLKNVEALTTNSNVRISFYDSSKTTQGTRSATQWTSSPVISAETDTNGYVTKLDLATARSFYKTNSGGKDVAFFRLCAPGIDGDSIIAVDQEITYTTTQGGTVYEWKNTGRAFVPADYEDRIVELETENEKLKTSLASAEQRIGDLENAESPSTTESETVPQAVIDGVSTLVNKSLSRADGNVIRFPISSDAHLNLDNELNIKAIKEFGKAQGEIIKLIGVDFISSLGDNSWASYANTTETVREQLKQYNRYTKPYIKGEQELNCEGNHDDANYSTVDNDGDGVTSSTEKLSLAETFSLIYAKNKDVVFDTDHYIDGYCYKDFEHLKTRVICLNTEQGNSEGGVVEGYQLKWFSEVALNMTGKTDWNVITLAHHPLDYPSNTLFKDCVNIVDAFINGSNFSYTTTNGTSISIDYSDKNCQYVGHFHGHAHAFSVVKMQKYVNSSYVDINAYEICIPNACYTRSNQYLGNTSERIARYCTNTTYNKSDVDGQRTSFNLVTIDLDNKIIYADNYGAGIDRQVSYSF